MAVKRDSDILNITQACNEVDVSHTVIITALRAGEIDGRNLKGRKGWVLTRAALLRWINGGNRKDSGLHEG